MEFRKERNLWYFTVDGKENVFDVNQNCWLGTKGQPIKTIKVSNTRMLRDINIPKILRSGINKTRKEKIELIDKFLSMGLGSIGFEDWGWNNETYELLNDNISIVAKYITDNELKQLNGYTVNSIVTMAKYQEYYNNRVNPAMGDVNKFIEFIDCIGCPQYIDISTHYFNKGIYNLISVRKLSNYYKYCEKLGKEPKKGDFLKNYSEIYQEYKSKEDEIINNIIYKNQTEKAYDKYIEDGITVEIPICVDDFIRLGEEFSNCLGGWELNNRIKNEKYCVAILRGEGWKVVIDFDRQYFQLGQCYAPYNMTPCQKAWEVAERYMNYIRSL